MEMWDHMNKYSLNGISSILGDYRQDEMYK